MYMHIICIRDECPFDRLMQYKRDVNGSSIQFQVPILRTPVLKNLYHHIMTRMHSFDPPLLIPSPTVSREMRPWLPMLRAVG